MTTTTNLTNYLKRITAILMAIILAVTLTPVIPPAQAHAATNLVTADTTAATLDNKDLANAEITVKNLAWTGKKLKPKVTVKVDLGETEWQEVEHKHDDGSAAWFLEQVPVKTAIKQGADYTLIITNAKGKVVKKPKAKGTYTATITGKGAYHGTVTKTFKVLKGKNRKIEDWMVTVKDTTLSVASRDVGSPKFEWNRIVVKYNGKKLKRNRDFKLSYKTPKGKKRTWVSWEDGAGYYTVTVKGKGKYKGTVVTGFEGVLPLGWLRV